MDPLSGLRMGCVPYLNARPLRHGLETSCEVPSLLADDFAAGRFDVALIPVFEMLKMPGVLAVDGVSISARGPVKSVILVHREPWDSLEEVALDPSSRSSSNLLRVLLSGYFQKSPRIVSKPRRSESARLLIGDPALDFQARQPEGWRIVDLAEAWFNWTGLPFVFAVWAIRPEVRSAAAVADRLREAAAEGLAAREEMARTTSDPVAARDYLMHCIRYGLGEEEKQGLARYASLLHECGALMVPPALPIWT